MCNKCNLNNKKRQISTNFALYIVYTYDRGDYMEEKNIIKYYKIPINMAWFWYWLIITGLFTLLSAGILFIFLAIPLVIYFQLKNTEYLYDEKEFIIKKGLFFKTYKTVSMQKIEEINTIFTWITLIVQGKPTTLTHIKNPKEELYKLQEVWKRTKNNKESNALKDELDNLSKIERLANLKEKGIITQEEFDEKKKQLLK